MMREVSSVYVVVACYFLIQVLNVTLKCAAIVAIRSAVFHSV